MDRFIGLILRCSRTRITIHLESRDPSRVLRPDFRCVDEKREVEGGGDEAREGRGHGYACLRCLSAAERRITRREGDDAEGGRENVCRVVGSQREREERGCKREGENEFQSRRDAAKPRIAGVERGPPECGTNARLSRSPMKTGKSAKPRRAFQSEAKLAQACDSRDMATENVKSSGGRDVRAKAGDETARSRFGDEGRTPTRTRDTKVHPEHTGERGRGDDNGEGDAHGEFEEPGGRKETDNGEESSAGVSGKRYAKWLVITKTTGAGRWGRARAGGACGGTSANPRALADSYVCDHKGFFGRAPVESARWGEAAGENSIRDMDGSELESGVAKVDVESGGEEEAYAIDIKMEIFKRRFGAARVRTPDYPAKCLIPIPTNLEEFSRYPCVKSRQIGPKSGAGLCQIPTKTRRSRKKISKINHVGPIWGENLGIPTIWSDFGV
ncbi:hypothetical protein B0H11DRAFT_1917693 [Mycena galericulata]|nr:hypothetical protein B0H11DRAFT_1917693 [Mycena galericulata]